MVSKKKKNKEKKKFFFFLLFLIGKIRHGIGKKGGYFRLGMGPKFGPWRWAENALDNVSPFLGFQYDAIKLGGYIVCMLHAHDLSTLTTDLQLVTY